MIPEAFVTHTDRRFLRLSEILVRGLAHFSSRPVVVFGTAAGRWCVTWPFG